MVQASEIQFVRGLGLNVKPIRDGFGFPLPCPLYKKDRCSSFANRPSVCGRYQCDLLKKHLNGEITLEQGTQTVRRAKELVADVLHQLPEGYTFEGIRHPLGAAWDSSGGIFATAENRQANAQLLLSFTKLYRFLQKHFEKPARS